jgi:hypothetical protein
VRNIWIDAGNDPNFPLLQKHGINGCFFDVRDPRLSVSYLSGIKDKGYAVGVYVADSPGWPEVHSGTGAECAEWMSTKVEAITGLQTTASFPKVQFDLERHDPVWIIDCLTRWRQLRPKQDTSWTLEGFQGGWMNPTFVAAVTSMKIRVAPQGYNGSMTKTFDTLAMARDLTKRGFPDGLITPFYDAGALPEYWDGFAFTQGRLKP